MHAHKKVPGFRVFPLDDKPQYDTDILLHDYKTINNQLPITNGHQDHNRTPGSPLLLSTISNLEEFSRATISLPKKTPKWEK